MKAFDIAGKIFFALFFIPAIGVHVYGLIHPFTDESIPSHIVHVLSYSICFFTLLRPVKFRLLLYCVAAIYPFLYHANCFLTHLLQQDKLTPVCLLVIIMMPLGAIWIIWKNKTALPH
jgi:hypothetical protein